MGVLKYLHCLLKMQVPNILANSGISKPLFRPSKSKAVDSDTYINDCLEKGLLLFICGHHTDSNYIF